MRAAATRPGLASGAMSGVCRGDLALGRLEEFHGQVGVELVDAGHVTELGGDEGLVAVQAGSSDPEQVVGQAEHPAYFDDFVERGDGGLEGFEGRPVLAGEIDVDEHLESPADRLGVDACGVAEDHAVAFQPLDAPQARRWCEADPVGELDIRHAPIALEFSNDTTIHCVHSQYYCAIMSLPTT